MKKHTNIIVVSFVLLVGCIILLKTAENPATFSTRLPASVRAALEQTQLIRESRLQAEELLRQEKAYQARMNLRLESEIDRTMMQAAKDRAVTRWQAVFAACVFIVCSGFVVFFGFSGAAGYKLITSNGSNIGLFLLMLKGKDKAAWQAEKEYWKAEQARLKTIDLHPESIIDATEPLALSESPLAMPDALQCLERGMMRKDGGDFLHGLHSETGENIHINFQHAETGIKIIGIPRKGKSNTMKNFCAQSLLKGWLNLWIDLHSPHPKSFVVQMGKLANAPNVKTFTSKNQAAEAFLLIDKIREGRLAGTLKSIPLIIAIDELLTTISKMKAQKIDAEETLRKLVTEGEKCEMYLIGAGHTWKANDIKTDVKDNLGIEILHQTKPTQGKTFCSNNEAAEAAKILDKGQTITILPTGEVLPASVPLWTPDAVNYVVANMTKTEFPAVDVQAEEIAEYGKAIPLDDYRAKKTNKRYDWA